MQGASRRKFLAGAAAMAVASLALPYGRSLAQPASQKPTRLVLLGTKGGPRVGPGRSNPSTLIVINGTPYVIDCGMGTSLQLVRAGVPLNTLRYLFFTHQHSDHNLEYGNVIYNGWATGLRTRVDAYGPPPLETMTRAYWELNRFDIETRIADEGRPDLRTLVFPHEFDRPGLVMQNDDVKVTAARVRHPPIMHAYAYRFDAADRSIVISGDTTYSPELIALAKGADVLVHEIIYVPGVDNLLKRVPNAATLREHLLASHTVPEDVGRVAAAAGVKSLVLSHLVPGDDASIPDEAWTEGVRKHYAGRIIVGKDLQEIL